MTPEDQPRQGPTGSGIDVDQDGRPYGVTATVTLSRKGMGMMQHRRGGQVQLDSGAAAAPPPPPPAVVSSMIYAVATEDRVGCPKCREVYPITPEAYNYVAECEACGCEFVIKPPGTPVPEPAPAAAPPAPRAARVARPKVPQRPPPRPRPTPPGPARTQRTSGPPAAASPAATQVAATRVMPAGSAMGTSGSEPRRGNALLVALIVLVSVMICLLAALLVVILFKS